MDPDCHGIAMGSFEVGSRLPRDPLQLHPDCHEIAIGSLASGPIDMGSIWEYYGIDMGLLWDCNWIAMGSL